MFTKLVIIKIYLRGVIMGKSSTLLESMKEQAVILEKDGQAAVDGNKAAGRRARKASLELEKLGKEFRKVSVGGLG